LDSTDQGLHRQVKIVRHTPSLGQPVRELFDPHVARANHEKCGLSWFERRRVGAHLVDYARSWHCMIGWGEC
jgi:hypothetical protein